MAEGLGDTLTVGLPTRKLFLVTQTEGNAGGSCHAYVKYASVRSTEEAQYPRRTASRKDLVVSIRQGVLITNVQGRPNDDRAQLPVALGNNKNPAVEPRTGGFYWGNSALLQERLDLLVVPLSRRKSVVPTPNGDDVRIPRFGAPNREMTREGVDARNP